ncbi:MAG: MFS transporter, partial [Syntrophomonadaceae bacterium]|nr:MFS transporter [Syntrophomonadaceae bacterium]
MSGGTGGTKKPGGWRGTLAPRTAMGFVILLGLVSLFGDVTYEGARSITGPFMAVLGASATAVGVVAGLGELIGYALRLGTGYLADRTGRYWLMTILGYCLNLLAVPALALAGNWQSAALLILLERMGKAVRTPARDAMLSHASAAVGRGWAFGLHEAMDQLGAVAGPLVVGAALYFDQGYRYGFAVLAVPALMALAVLLAARFLYPRPHELEVRVLDLHARGLARTFWVYLGAAGLLAAGFADYPLIAFHFEKQLAVSATAVPLFYALAMGCDALAALVFGRLFDRIGLTVMALAAGLSALFAPLVFLGGPAAALAGSALWGVGMGAQESVMRAAVGALAPAP